MMADEGMIFGQSFANNDVPPFEVRVLIVDDDVVSLKLISAILTSLKYQVVGFDQPLDALEELRKNKGYFDLIVMDVHMPDMDGFTLKQMVDEECEIPFIFISADNDEKLIIKALMNGVVRYISKPATLNDFKGIWQFAKTSSKGKAPILAEETQYSGEESLGESSHDQNLNPPSSSKESTLITQNDNVLKEPMNPGKDHGQTAPKKKKKKMVWTNELGTKFLEAINFIGLERAFPKRIHEVMDVPGLTRKNVASRLQYYRDFLRQFARQFAEAIDNGNDKNVLLSRMASKYSSVTLRGIQYEYHKILEQRELTSWYPSSEDISSSTFRYEQSKLWNNPTASHHYLPIQMNPTAQVGLSAGNMNHLSSPYQLPSTSNIVQIYQESSPRQQAINPYGLVNYNFSSHALAQTPASNCTNYYARIGITTPRGRVEMSQMQKNGNGVSNTFSYENGLMMNETNINNAMSDLLNSNSSYMAGRGVCPISEVYNANQSLLMSMGVNNMENIFVEPLYQQQQQRHPHQLSNAENSLSFAIGGNNDTSNFTSHMSQFSGIHYGGTSMEGGHDNEVVTEEFNVNVHPSDDYIPSSDQISNQLQNNVEIPEFDLEKMSEFEQYFSHQDWDGPAARR